MALKVFKATVQFVVFLTAETKDAASLELGDKSVSAMEERSDEDWISSMRPKIVALDEVPDEGLTAELKDIGNDGSFFDDQLGEAE